MNRYERLSTLLELLTQRGSLDVDSLAQELDVSAATIRRDLDHLSQQQLLTRTRGGAVVNSSVAYDLPLRYKTARRATEKERIARAAAEMVSVGSVVGLNGGTTTTEVARALAIRPELSSHTDGQGLTIVTNALNIAHELAIRPHVKIVVVGGVARHQSFELIGPLATRILEEITMDTVFLGVDAIDASLGAYAHNEGEASINRLMVERSKQVVVVADSSKLGTRAFAQICPVSRLKIMITDKEAEPSVVQAFEAEGIRVLAV